MLSFLTKPFKKDKKSILRVTFENLENNQKGWLHFELDNHRFVNRWKENLKKSRELPILDNGVFYGSCINDKKSILKVMLESLQIVNELAKKPEMRIEMQPHLDMDQKFLDALHKEFERLSADLDAYGADRKKGSDALINLNTSIHQMEDIVSLAAKPEESVPYFSFDVNFVGGKIEELKRKDFDYFTLNRKYGELYLNYNTVGVPVYYAYIHKEQKPPVSQSTFKADFTVSFNPDYQFEEWDKMGEWLDENFKLDVNDKQLALGYIPLGRCLDIHTKTPKDLAQFVKTHRKIVDVDFVETI